MVLSCCMPSIPFRSYPTQTSSKVSYLMSIPPYAIRWKEKKKKNLHINKYTRGGTSDKYIKNVKVNSLNGFVRLGTFLFVSESLISLSSVIVVSILHLVRLIGRFAHPHAGPSTPHRGGSRHRDSASDCRVKYFPGHQRRWASLSRKSQRLRFF